MRVSGWESITVSGWPLPSKSSGWTRLPDGIKERLDSRSLSLIEPGANAGEVPRQELTDPIHRIIWDLLEYLTQIILGIEHIQFCHLYRIGVSMAAARWPPESEPVWSQFFLPRVSGWMAARQHCSRCRHGHHARSTSFGAFHRVSM